MQDYKKTYEAIEKRLEAFKSAKEWSDFISLLTALDKPLKNLPDNFDIASFPKHFLFKRLNQCLNPSLPAGVHNKVIQTYGLVLEKFAAYLNNAESEEKINECSNIIFNNLLIGMFTFFSYSKTQSKLVFLTLVSDKVLRLRVNYNLYVRNIIIGVFPGMQEDPEIANQSNEIILKIIKITSEEHFWNHFWEVFLLLPEQRTSMINFLIRNEDIIDGLKNKKIEFMQKNPVGNYSCFYYLNDRLVVNALIAGLSDKSHIVIRGTLDILCSLFTLDDFSNEHKKELLRKLMFLTTKREVGLNKRIYTIIDETGKDYRTIEKRNKEFKINVYKEKYDMITYDYIVIALSEFFQQNSNSLALYFKILNVLIDKEAICDYIVEELILESIFKVYSMRKEEGFDVVEKSIKIFCDNADLWYIWFCIFKTMDEMFKRIDEKYNLSYKNKSTIAKNSNDELSRNFENVEQSTDNNTVITNTNKYKEKIYDISNEKSLLSSINTEPEQNQDNFIDSNANIDLKIDVQPISESILDNNTLLGKNIDTNNENMVLKNDDGDIITKEKFEIKSEEIISPIDITNMSRTHDCTHDSIFEPSINKTNKENLKNFKDYKEDEDVKKINSFLNAIIFGIEKSFLIDKEILEIHLPFFIVLIIKHNIFVDQLKLYEFLNLCFEKIIISQNKEKRDFEQLYFYIVDYYNFEKNENAELITNSYIKSLGNEITNMFDRKEDFITNTLILKSFVKNFELENIEPKLFMKFYDCLVTFNYKNCNPKDFYKALETGYMMLDSIKGTKYFKEIMSKSYLLYELLLINNLTGLLYRFNILFERSFEEFMLNDFNDRKNIVKIFETLKEITEYKEQYFYSTIIIIFNHYMSCTNDLLYYHESYDRTEFIKYINAITCFDNLFQFILNLFKNSIPQTDDINYIEEPDISKINSGFILVNALIKYSARFKLFLQQDSKSSDVNKKKIHNKNKIVLFEILIFLASKNSFEIQFNSLNLIDYMIAENIIIGIDILKLNLDGYFFFLNNNNNQDLLLSSLKFIELMANSNNEGIQDICVDFFQNINIEENLLYKFLYLIMSLKNTKKQKKIIINIIKRYYNLEVDFLLLKFIQENRQSWDDQEMKEVNEILCTKMIQFSENVYIKNPTDTYDIKKIKSANKIFINDITELLISKESKIFIDFILANKPDSIFIANCNYKEKIHAFIIKRQQPNFEFLITFEMLMENDVLHDCIVNASNEITYISTIPRNRLNDHMPFLWILKNYIRNPLIKDKFSATFIKIVENSNFLLNKNTENILKRIKTTDEKNQMAVDLFTTLNEVYLMLNIEETKTFIHFYFNCVYNVLRVKNINIYTLVLQKHTELSNYSRFNKYWNKSFLELFFESKFFDDTKENLKFKIKIMENYIKKNGTKIMELFNKLEMGFFVSREVEITTKVQILRKMSFMYFCSDKDALVEHLPPLIQKIVEYFGSNYIELRKEAYFLSRMIILRTEIHKLFVLWPLLIENINTYFDRLITDRISRGELSCLVEIIKILELIFVLKIDQIVELKWSYIPAFRLQNDYNQESKTKYKQNDRFPHTYFDQLHFYIKNIKEDIKITENKIIIPKKRIYLFREYEIHKLTDILSFINTVNQYYEEMDINVFEVDEDGINDLIIDEFMNFKMK
ncbi:hypothetical protein COBT_000089 [Conglomerata obtusa]